MLTVRLKKPLGDLSSAQCPCLLWDSPNLLEICLFCSVHAYCATHTTSWRSVCSAQCPCLLWDSPNLLEICLFCTVSMLIVRLTQPLGDLSVLHSVHAYCATHTTSWRSVCSAQCPYLRWDSPNLLEICLFCTVSMLIVRLTQPLGDPSVLHSVHAYCATHTTSWRSVCSAQCPYLL